MKAAGHSDLHSASHAAQAASGSAAALLAVRVTEHDSGRATHRRLNWGKGKVEVKLGLGKG